MDSPTRRLYRYLSVTGKVKEITTDGACEHIEGLAERYVGREYPGEIRSERVVLSIHPERVYSSG